MRATISSWRVGEDGHDPGRQLVKVTGWIIINCGQVALNKNNISAVGK